MDLEKIDILMVDDDPGASRLVKRILTGSRDLVDFAIQTAGTVAEGLARLKGHSFDLILLDLGLPDSDGLQTIDTVCQACPHIPIVVFTSYADEETGVQAIKRGASDYLVKGKFFRDMLARTIRYSFERKKVDTQLRQS
ncbi:MAG: response regulator, partial [Planctomycetota bacterium]